MKIEFHYSLIILIILSIYTSVLKEVIIFIILILLHEIGHIIIALICKQKIKKITITALGSIAEVNIDCSNNKKALIYTGGIIVNVIILLILLLININNKYLEIIYNYNILILLFNMLPIFPLDGFNILDCTFNLKKISKDYIMKSIVSFGVLSGLLIYSIVINSMGFIIVTIFILFKNIERTIKKDEFILKKIINNLKYQ